MFSVGFMFVCLLSLCARILFHFISIYFISIYLYSVFINSLVCCAITSVYGWQIATKWKWEDDSEDWQRQNQQQQKDSNKIKKKKTIAKENNKIEYAKHALAVNDENGAKTRWMKTFHSI